MSMYQTSAATQQQQFSSPSSSFLPARTPLATPSTSFDQGHASNIDPHAATRARLRLPPTIESALVPLAHSTRQTFLQALVADQSAALQPDYRTSFRSANDVVKRLLPYHVWHVNEEDLRWVLNKGKAESQETVESSSKESFPIRSLPAKRSRDDDHDIEEQIFPTSEEAHSLFARYSTLESRAKKLRCELTGGTSGLEGTLFYQESLYNIEKKAVELERELLNAEHEKLRQAKELAIEKGVTWDTLMRIGPSLAQGAGTSSTASLGAGVGMGCAATTYNGFSTTSFQTSVGSLNGSNNNTPSTSKPTSSAGQLNVGGTNSLPSTPPNPNAKPRGRPRKTRDKDGKIIATPPTLKPADQPKATTKTGSSSGNGTPTAGSDASKPPNTPIPASKPAASPASPSASTSTSAYGRSLGITIPTHPIPLVLPLSTLARLSSLGIAPVPAPHLLPAISAQQAQRRNNRAQSSTPPLPIPAPVHSTAPRPAPTNQEEPALLMGITEAPLPRKTESDSSTSISSPSPSSNQSTQQMLHVSVVLSKLSPSQLSGLAHLMQSLQGNGGRGSSASPPSTGTARSNRGR